MKTGLFNFEKILEQAIKGIVEAIPSLKDEKNLINYWSFKATQADQIRCLYIYNIKIF